MEFFDVVRARRSIRRYRRGEPVRAEDLKLILEAMRLAPSAKNLQPWHVIVVRERGRKEALARQLITNASWPMLAWCSYASRTRGYRQNGTIKTP